MSRGVVLAGPLLALLPRVLIDCPMPQKNSPSQPPRKEASLPVAVSKVTYDGGKDISILIHRMEVSAGFSCEGQVDNCKPADVELLFIAYTSDWHMQGKRVVNLLIDGKAATAGKTDWDGQAVEANNLVEYNDVTISLNCW